MSVLNQFAAYNCDAYGAQVYGTTTCATTGSNAGSNSSGVLSNTGEAMILPLALGGAIVIASVILLVKTLVRRKAISQK